jgi:cytochrome c
LVHTAGDGGKAPNASLNVTPAVYEGWKYFSANCERCHGQDAVGSSFAPSLIKSIREGSVLGTGPLTHDVYIGTVVAGRPAKGMPAWVELLDREKMENIWAYLSARASGQLAPGRPIKQGG